MKEVKSSLSLPKKFEAEIAGKKLTIETGRFAAKAQGSCTVQYGDTVVLATAVMNKEIKEGIEYFPLLVDYEEKLYAAGKIKGSRFIKREGRPSDEAILTARLVDRSIRPLFSEEIRHDVQVVLTVLSVDQENDPDIVSLMATSAALAISPIPWAGPISAVRVGLVDGEWVLNPSYEALEKSDLDLVVVGTGDKVLMLEGGAKEVPEEKILEGIEYGQKHLKEGMDLIAKLIKEVGQEKMVIEYGEESAEEKVLREKIEQKIIKYSEEEIVKLLNIADNEERAWATDELKERLEELLKEDSEVSKEERVKSLKLVDEIIIKRARRFVVEQEKRIDGRKTDEI
ncbi:MAG: Polyribonucleotide nucleotidyltransferase, RNA binding protein, partial [uncultured bacterium]